MNTPPGIGGAIDVAFVGRTAYVLVANVGPFFGEPDEVAGIYRMRPERHRRAGRRHRRMVGGQPAGDRLRPAGRRPVRDGAVPWRVRGHRRPPQPRAPRPARRARCSELLAFGNVVPTGLAAAGRTLFVGLAGPVPHLPEDGKVVALPPRSAARWRSRPARRSSSTSSWPRSPPVRALAGHLGPAARCPANAGAPASPNTGSLTRVDRHGGLTPVAGPLDRPTSVAFTRRNAFVVTLTGKVLKISGIRSADRPPSAEWGGRVRQPVAITAPSPQLTQRSATDSRPRSAPAADRARGRARRTSTRLHAPPAAHQRARARPVRRRARRRPTPPTRASQRRRPTRSRRSSASRARSRSRSRSRACRTAPGLVAPPRPPRRRDGAAVAAHERRRLHPARRHEHVRADDVDRVRQPRLRPHPQRVRPAPHRRRLLGRRGRGGRLGRLAVRARLRHRRLDPPARVLQRRLRPQAVARPRAQHRPVPEHRGRGRVHAHARPARAPRRGPDAGDADHRRPRRRWTERCVERELGDPADVDLATLRVLVADDASLVPAARSCATPATAPPTRSQHAGRAHREGLAQAAPPRARDLPRRARRRRRRLARRAARPTPACSRAAPRQLVDAARGRGDHTLARPHHAALERLNRHMPEARIRKAVEAARALREEVGRSSATTASCSTRRTRASRRTTARTVGRAWVITPAAVVQPARPAGHRRSRSA